MSITDELREWAKGSTLSLWTAEHLLAIADRIDEAHKHAIGYVDDRDPETMAENGWVKLPKDADGEYIHMGDRMDDGEMVVRIVLTDGSWEPTVYTASTPNQLHEHYCHHIRHHHAPTVEDVLTKFGIDWEYEDNCEDRAALLKEYAKRLTLAGDAE